MSKRDESRSQQAPAGTAIMETNGNPGASASQEEIAALAYSYWEARGYQGGSSEEDWLQAERELRERRSQGSLSVQEEQRPRAMGQTA
jgi:hypothetical protein